MGFDISILVGAFYLLMVPFGVLIATLTFSIKRKSVLWFLGSIWPVTVTVCDVIIILSFIKEMMNTIIKSR